MEGIRVIRQAPWVLFVAFCGGSILLTAPVDTFASSQNTASLLVMFAHPDDDITVGPLLAHYAKRGITVQLVTVASGDNGVSAHAGIPAGQQLERVRQEEIRQACKAYGIEEPILLGRHDGSLALMRDKECLELMGQLEKIISEQRPTVLITFGPEGYTGHSDHRILGALVTETFQSWNAEKHQGYAPQKLYYPTIPKTQWASMPQLLKDNFLFMNDSFVNAVVDAADGCKEAVSALENYRSQFTSEQMATLNDFFSGSILQGKVHLRQAFPKQQATIREQDLFEGVTK